MSRHRFFAHVPATMLDRYLPALEQMPLGLEIYMDQVALRDDFRPELERLGAMLREGARACRFHAPFRDINPGGFDPDILEISRRRLIAALDAAKHFGVRDLVAHTAWDPRMYGLDRAEWLDRSTTFWLDMGEQAAKRGCRFGLENVFDLQPTLLAELLDRLPSPIFGVNLDIGHWFAWGAGSLSEWFDILGPRLLSLHLHDNNGVHDEHLPVGAGKIPWSELYPLVRAVGRPLDWTVENRSVAAVVASANHIGRYAGVADLSHLVDIIHPEPTGHK
ncbi:MAG: sugar phosphate isomerase/epimerase [bacterium]|nr:sugar phosphate isomerase/epimerase [bacterium]